MLIATATILSLAVSVCADPIYFDFGSNAASPSNYNNVTNGTGSALTDVFDTAGNDTGINMDVIQNGNFWNYGNTNTAFEWCSEAQNSCLYCSGNASPTNVNGLWIEFSNLEPGSSFSMKALCWTCDFSDGANTHVELWDPDTMTVLDEKVVDARMFLMGRTATLTANANADGKIVFACDGSYGVVNAGTLTGTAAAIPEPGTIGLLALGGISLLRRRRWFIG